MPQQSAFEYLRSGTMPFFRLPQVDPMRPDALKGLDAALLGVAFDGGTTYQPGARLAPFHVRRVSALVQSAHPALGLDVFRTLNAADAGNIVFPPFDPDAMRGAVERDVSVCLAAGVAPFLVGGDHSISLPALRALHKHHGPIAVLHVDAHMDTSGPETWGAAHHHGTPFRHALAEGLIARGQLFQVGLRSTWGSTSDADFAKSHDVRQMPIEEVADSGVARLCGEIRERVGTLPLYVSFDVDALDPAFAPGTGTPVPGGMTSREALQLVRGLRGLRLAGMDVVEVCPPLDHSDLTSHLAAHLLFEGLAVLASTRQKG